VLRDSYSPRFVLGTTRFVDHATRSAILVALVEALVAANRALLRSLPVPRLFESGVRYQAEGPSTDDWQDIATTLERGNGDCEDLAAWWIAELREAGELAAAPLIHWYPSGDRTWYHVLVRRADGTVDDPSRALGM
jgi:hypothetical protein